MKHKFCLFNFDSNIDIDEEVVETMHFEKDGEQDGIVENVLNSKPPSCGNESSTPSTFGHNVKLIEFTMVCIDLMMKCLEDDKTLLSLKLIPSSTLNHKAMYVQLIMIFLPL
jgi:hypothetical protein